MLAKNAGEMLSSAPSEYSPTQHEKVSSTLQSPSFQLNSDSRAYCEDNCLFEDLYQHQYLQIKQNKRRETAFGTCCVLYKLCVNMRISND